MKKLIALLLFPLALNAQTNSIIFFDHSNGGGNSSIQCNYSSPNVWLATSGLGDGTASISYSTVSNCWVVSSLTSGGEWTHTAPQYPTNTATAQLYNAGGAITGFFGTYYLHFNNFVAPIPAVTNWINQTTNFWSAPGDMVYFSGSGRNLSAGVNSNQLVVSVDGNPVFTGPYTAAGGFTWTLNGWVQWDGTNFISSGRFNSGDTNTPEGLDSELFTNVVTGTNAWQWAVLGDTNGLTFDSASIVAGRLPTGDAPQHSFAPGNRITSLANFWTPQTIATSSNSTLGSGAGLMTWDTNYVYVSVGTNLWKRVALTNW